MNDRKSASASRAFSYIGSPVSGKVRWLWWVSFQPLLFLILFLRDNFCCHRQGGLYLAHVTKTMISCSVNKMMISENKAEWENSVNMLIITHTEDVLTVMIVGALLLIINCPYLMELSKHFCIEYNVMTCINPIMTNALFLSTSVVHLLRLYSEKLRRADHCIIFFFYTSWLKHRKYALFSDPFSVSIWERCTSVVWNELISDIFF